MPHYDIKIVCPKCDTVAPKDNREKAESQVDSHNNSIHNGEEVAYVEGEHNPLTPFDEYIDDVHKKGHIYYAYRNESMLRIICPECEEIKIGKEIDVLTEEAEKHNALHHNGEAIAGIVTEDLDGTTADRRRHLGDDLNAAEIIAKCSSQSAITQPSNVDKIS